ncbi:hypothetical protein Ctob_007472 [Chrysochromulina tobinii]|uniref:Uncharacterized protein n=1 Tax=Chrysochromulina tobinii TaxID=1460289 RepID=A0A0M0JA27_9EUKA|nr:hypothetical protein Ctob_007472 [Chrysochromulina tobinii]|eukprot:KOO23063.1 hypothetical protein Ctob_007472 [Chrysochromulina sp. CCMP291]
MVFNTEIKSGRRMTHTAVRSTYIMHTRTLYDRTTHASMHCVLPYGRRVMLSDHQPCRDISRGDSGMP